MPKHKKSYASEEQEQSAFVCWLRLKRILFTSVPNESKRSVVYGAMLKRTGMSKGVPDLLIFTRSRKLTDAGHLGIAIEMKSMKGKLRKEQAEWLENLGLAGWETKVCYGCKEAIDFLTEWGY